PSRHVSPCFPYTTLFRSGVSRPSERHGQRAFALRETSGGDDERQTDEEGGVEGEAHRPPGSARARLSRVLHAVVVREVEVLGAQDRKSTRLNSSHLVISY